MLIEMDAISKERSQIKGSGKAECDKRDVLDGRWDELDKRFATISKDIKTKRYVLLAEKWDSMAEEEENRLQLLKNQGMTIEEIARVDEEMSDCDEISGEDDEVDGKEEVSEEENSKMEVEESSLVPEMKKKKKSAPVSDEVDHSKKKMIEILDCWDKCHVLKERKEKGEITEKYFKSKTKSFRKIIIKLGCARYGFKTNTTARRIIRIAITEFKKEPLQFAKGELKGEKKQNPSARPTQEKKKKEDGNNERIPKKKRRKRHQRSLMSHPNHILPFLCPKPMFRLTFL